MDRTMIAEIASAVERLTHAHVALDAIDMPSIQRLGLMLGSHDLTLLPKEIQPIVASLLNYQLLIYPEDTERVMDALCAAFMTAFVVSRFYSKGGEDLWRDGNQQQVTERVTPQESG